MNEHPPASWVIPIAWPATVTIPVRTAGSSLAATVNAALPLPVPPAGAVTAIHGTVDVAPQAHAACVATPTVVAPPALGKGVVGGGVTV